VLNFILVCLSVLLYTSAFNLWTSQTSALKTVNLLHQCFSTCSVGYALMRMRKSCCEDNKHSADLCGRETLLCEWQTLFEWESSNKYQHQRDYEIKAPEEHQITFVLEKTFHFSWLARFSSLFLLLHTSNILQSWVCRDSLSAYRRELKAGDLLGKNVAWCITRLTTVVDSSPSCLKLVVQ